MTTHELAKKLLEQPDIHCLNYVQEAEEFGETTTVRYYPPGKGLPYAKGDTPENLNGVVLIEGWIAS